MHRSDPGGGGGDCVINMPCNRCLFQYYEYNMSAQTDRIRPEIPEISHEQQNKKARTSTG